MKNYILSIDAGTTGITILIINNKLKILNKFYKEFTQYYPKPGWVEHDGEEIWSTIKSLLKKIFAKYDSKNCKGIGITNQRETTIIWNKNTNKPIYNAIVWQCKRSQSICEKIKSSKNAKKFTDKTGLVIDSYFSATKIKWLLDNIKGAKKLAQNGNLAFGTVDTWILWNLTNGKVHATDHTNASRTLIYNIDKFYWDDELLSILEIPKSLLPEIKNSSDNFGKTELKFIKIPIPITAIIGDQQAALYGQGCISPGDTKCTYGTGCFLLTNIGNKRIKIKSNLITTIACDLSGKPIYAIEGSVFMGGAIMQWLRDELQIIKNIKDSEKIAYSIEDSNEIIIVPSFTGLGAPYWNMNARGVIVGLTRGTNKKHFIRASLESIAFQVNDVLKTIMKDTKIKLTSLKVDGGACKNNFLMQFQSNIINLKIERPTNIESTALGAGILAGLKVKFWKNPKDIFTKKEIDKTFTSNLDKLKRDNYINSWNKAINMVINKS